MYRCNSKINFSAGPSLSELYSYHSVLVFVIPALVSSVLHQPIVLNTFSINPPSYSVPPGLSRSTAQSGIILILKVYLPTIPYSLNQCTSGFIYIKVLLFCSQFKFLPRIPDLEFLPEIPGIQGIPFARNCYSSFKSRDHLPFNNQHQTLLVSRHKWGLIFGSIGP